MNPNTHWAHTHQALGTGLHLHLTTTQQGNKYYYSRFTNNDTLEQRNQDNLVLLCHLVISTDSYVDLMCSLKKKGESGNVKLEPTLVLR